MGRRGGGDVPAGSSPAVGTTRTDGLAGGCRAVADPLPIAVHIYGRQRGRCLPPMDLVAKRARERPCHSSDLGSRAHPRLVRSEEHTSELQSLLRISDAVFFLNKKQNDTTHSTY